MPSVIFVGKATWRKTDQSILEGKMQIMYQNIEEMNAIYENSCQKVGSMLTFIECFHTFCMTSVLYLWVKIF